MKKKFIIISIVVILLAIIGIGYIYLYNYLKIKNAKIEVSLVDDLTLEFNDKKKVSDYIESINGQIVNDYEIDSTKLGNKNIKFNFINDDNIKVSYEYQIEVVDTVKPVIWLSNSYTVQKNSDIDLTKKILCGDNYDSNPTCVVEGEYDINTVGNYPLVFRATDNSGNVNEINFTLNVVEPTNNNIDHTKTYTDFNNVRDTHKTDDNKIGLDISSWQGDVDFEKIKESGVDFVMIRVGYSKGKDGEYVLDTKFKQNIENANKYGIDSGVYFYSYANSEKKAIKDAKWVIKQIKNYKITLPVSFDWEEWNSFNGFHLSFFGLNNMADGFINTVKKAGYEGMLYSSKLYLEKIWFPTDNNIWLAHYTTNTDYTGNYKMWQLCNNGKIDGIDGDVDIDIMY